MEGEWSGVSLPRRRRTKNQALAAAGGLSVPPTSHSLRQPDDIHHSHYSIDGIEHRQLVEERGLMGAEGDEGGGDSD